MMSRKKFLFGIAAVVGFYCFYTFIKRFFGSADRFKYNITKQWNGDPSVGITTVEFRREENVLEMHVMAPFYNDPPAPNGPAGEPFPQLWDYEVVEAFFLSDSGKYLEVELCPHGQHLVLLLDGRRHMIKDQLPLQFASSILGTQWTGVARIPVDYFPAMVTKFNLYAIHGKRDGTEVYEAYSPVPGDQPDLGDIDEITVYFSHRLEYFADIDFAALVPENHSSSYTSSVWPA